MRLAWPCLILLLSAGCQRHEPTALERQLVGKWTVIAGIPGDPRHPAKVNFRPDGTYDITITTSGAHGLTTTTLTYSYSLDGDILTLHQADRNMNAQVAVNQTRLSLSFSPLYAWACVRAK